MQSEKLRSLTAISNPAGKVQIHKKTGIRIVLTITAGTKRLMKHFQDDIEFS